MRVVIKAAEDLQIGGYGYYIHAINGVARFDYDETFTTAQGVNSGLILAHDILEHALSIEDSNLNELSALGAILAHREHDFYNAFGVDGFASIVAEELRYYIILNGIDNLKEDTCSSKDSYVDEKYAGYEDEILESIEDVLEEVLEEEEITEELASAIHKLAKSYIAKGCNEIARKDARYKLGFDYIFECVKDELEKACSQESPEDFYNYGAKITLEINFDKGVGDYRITYPL